MVNRIQSIPIERLVSNPANPNRMSSGKFTKLVRNIERTGLYEPLVVRPKGKCFEIINGHHRRQALQKLGVKRVDVVVWDVDDEQADIFLATLNRLGGSDVLEKKLALLGRLNKKMKAAEMAKLLPQTARQIERLGSLNKARKTSQANAANGGAGTTLQCMVFFLSDDQKEKVEKAMSLAGKGEKTKAARNAAAITRIAKEFLI